MIKDGRDNFFKADDWSVIVNPKPSLVATDNF